MEQTAENKSFFFAVRIVKLSKYLQEAKQKFTLSKQLLRSGTSVGAKSGRFYFQAKHSAKGSGRNKLLGLHLLQATEFLSETEFKSIHADCCELEKMLTAIIKSAKE